MKNLRILDKTSEFETVITDIVSRLIEPKKTTLAVSFRNKVKLRLFSLPLSELRQDESEPRGFVVR